MSLRARLLFAVGAVALVALLVADFATYSSLGSFLVSQTDQRLLAAAGPIETKLDKGESLSFPLVSDLAPGMFVQLRSAGGQVQGTVDGVAEGGQLISPQLPQQIAVTQGPAGNDGAPRVYFTTGPASPGGPQFRVRASELVNGFVLVLALPLDQAGATLHRLLVVEIVVTAFALVAAALLGWWLVRVGLRPLGQVEETANAIAEGELGRRVPGANPSTEVGRLAGAFNTMLSRIEDAFTRRDQTEAELRRSEERLRRFVADASHELRTPLAAVGAYAELFERGAAGRPEDLERAMAGIRSESARMGDLVEDLLLLARLDEGRPLRREPVELVSLVARAVESARAMGPEWPIRLAASRPLEVEGDSTRLRQVVDNLLANVRAHTPRGTSTTVTIREEAMEALVEVADNGPGLDEEQAHRVFERFYRADSSRSRHDSRAGGDGRATGGSGLGLSIVAAIVHAHGGNASVRPTPGGGATFTIRIPIAPIAPDAPHAPDAPDARDAPHAPDAARSSPAADLYEIS